MKRLLTLLLFLLPSLAAAYEVRSESLVLEFADNGDLLQARACLPVCSGQPEHAIDIGGMMQGSRRVVSFTSYATEAFTLTPGMQGGVTVLTFENPDNHSQRRWRIPAHGWKIELEASGAERIDVGSGRAFRPSRLPGFGGLLEQPRYMTVDGNQVRVSDLDDVAPEGPVSGWAGFRNRFWTIMVHTEKPRTIQFQTGAKQQNPGLVLPDTTGKPVKLSVYLGPLEADALRSADAALPHMMYASLWFWLRWICQGMAWLIGHIHTWVPSWGLSIMLLSLAVSLLMRPLSLVADRLQDRVYRTEAKLGPELKKIKQKYRGEEQSKRVLALYRKHHVHPLYSLQSLLGVMLVIPVFIGAFDMLAENIWLANEPFLWIADLSRPDAVAMLPFSLPFLGGQLNLLPFVMTLLSVWASVLHRHAAMDAAQARKHIRNLVLMALGFLLLFYTFPAGMVLYWTTNNGISVARYGWRRGRKAKGKS